MNIGCQSYRNIISTDNAFFVFVSVSCSEDNIYYLNILYINNTLNTWVVYKFYIYILPISGTLSVDILYCSVNEDGTKRALQRRIYTWEAHFYLGLISLIQKLVCNGFQSTLPILSVGVYCNKPGLNSDTQKRKGKLIPNVDKNRLLFQSISQTFIGKMVSCHFCWVSPRVHIGLHNRYKFGNNNVTGIEHRKLFAATSTKSHHQQACEQPLTLNIG